VSVRLLPVEGLPEVRAGDDLGALLGPALSALGLRTGDVVVVTPTGAATAAGRGVPAPGGGRAAWVARETRRVVARRDDLVIAETEHGFVCANAGVDASNVEAGFLSLLPVDPDGSAERLRETLREGLGMDVGVVITDTFGRAWRRGLVNVAIGCAGIAALVDLRGTLDHGGRELEATVVALADEVAAASGLVMGKASGVPAAVVRGLVDRGLDDGGSPSPARELVRPPEEDLFRESPLLSISARRTIRSFGPGQVPREVTTEAVRAACAAPAPHASRPWSFTALTSPAARRRLAAAVGGAWAADLERDGASRDEIAERTARTEALLGGAPVLIVPWVRFDAMHPYPDSERSRAEQELFLLSSGAAIENLLLAFHAQGYASCWAPTTLFCQDETREALGVASEWYSLGAVAAGPMPPGEGAPLPPPPVDLGTVLSDR
jgi:coenzyme F420-0:L-glutamate ligase/coenzyme F420-1:gamma-L-glutamate ligase